MPVRGDRYIVPSGVFSTMAAMVEGLRHAGRAALPVCPDGYENVGLRDRCYGRTIATVPGIRVG